MNLVYKYIGGDKAIWLVVFLLGVASILLVYSSIVTLAYQFQEGNTGFYLFRHSAFVISGILIIYGVHKMKYAYYSRIAQIALLISIPLLLATLLIGTNLNEAARWLKIPVINQSFQTSDFAKLALIMYVARILSKKQGEIKGWRTAFLPVVIPVVIVCALILPANFSTAAVLFTSCLVLMFIGRISFKHIISLIGLGIVAIGLVFLVAKTYPEAFPRAETWNTCSLYQPLRQSRLSDC